MSVIGTSLNNKGPLLKNHNWSKPL